MEYSVGVVKMLLDEIKRLEAENEKLREQIAQLTAQQSVDVVDGDGC
jgi:cell division septum initiation protein DivIVA